MQVLVAMSGGVDSSVAAAVLRDQGHEVVGVTLKLWGGESDSGCCSVSDVDDARRVADHLGIEHLVFNFGDDFTEHVVDPYVADHAAGRTPNPCIECNRHLKFDRLLVRAQALGFDAVATGHHASIGRAGSGVPGDGGGGAASGGGASGGAPRIVRGIDAAKDQSYVLHMLTVAQQEQLLLPIGAMTKAEVRARATELGLRTANKPDSQDVCFITRAGGGREAFLGKRIPMRPGRLVERDGTEVGQVDAVEMVTVGQRRGLGGGRDGAVRYALSVDVDAATVVVGGAEEMAVGGERLSGVVWADDDARAHMRVGQGVTAAGITAQASAHGAPIGVARVAEGPDGLLDVEWTMPQRRVAPGQSVVFYDGDAVLGGGTVR